MQTYALKIFLFYANLSHVYELRVSPKYANVLRVRLSIFVQAILQSELKEPFDSFNAILPCVHIILLCVMKLNQRGLNVESMYCACWYGAFL